MILNGNGFGIIMDEVQRTINGLGAIPTDEELATVYQYTPVHSGWIAGRAVNGFGAPDLPPGTPTDIATEMLKLQKQQLKISTWNMYALSALAALSILKLIKEMKVR